MKRSTAPQLQVEAPRAGFTWVDGVVMLALLAMFWSALHFGKGMLVHFDASTQTPIDRSVAQIPYYAGRTLLRMWIAFAFSLVFAIATGYAAAKSLRARAVILPALDILQSVPVLGFLSATVTGFMALFPGSLLGVECAAIFAIFTSQAWNMAFSLYQSMRTVPAELREASSVFQLSAWHRFWRLEMPFAAPGLLWNMMMSMSGGWFFVVASEAISVSNQNIKLPGVGSYIALAIEARDLGAIGWAIGGMLIGITLYDQLFFRPLVAWADKFRFEEGSTEEAPRSWLLTWLRRTDRLKRMILGAASLLERSLVWFRRDHDGTSIKARPHPPNAAAARVWDAAIAAAVLIAVIWLVRFIHTEVGWSEVFHVLLLGLYTMIRVVVLIALAALAWVPIGVWIGMNPRWAGRLQGVAQFMAAFPANLMFPVAVLFIVRWQLNPNIWLAPLMVLGTQWYLLFNVIAGASTVPAELRYAAENLGLTGWLKWRRYLLPAVFPSSSRAPSPPAAAPGTRASWPST